MTAPAPGRGPLPVWKRNLRVLVGGQLLAVSAMGIVIPLIPFFVRELGVSDRTGVERWSGLIFSGPFLAAAAMSPVWGHLGDRFGHKKMVVRAIVGLAVVNLLIALVHSPLQFWLLRFLQGAVTGFIPAALAITSASTPPERLPDAMGKLAASASAGRLVGPALGGVLASFLAFREIFLFVGAVIAVAAVIVILFLEDPPRARPAASGSPAANLRWALGEPRLRIALPGLTVAMIGVSMAMPLFPLYVEDLLPPGADAAPVTGVGFAVVAGFTLITSSFLGRVAARIGLRALLVGALELVAVALALHPVVRGVPAMLAVRALLGVAVAGVAPVLHTMISRAGPEGMRGGITGLASSATILGFFLGPLAGGWLASGLGVHGVFRLSAAITAACGAAAAVAARRTRRPAEILPLPEEMPR